MKTLASRRRPLTLLSGIAVIAVVAVTPLALGARLPHRQSQAGTAPRAPYVSYQVYASPSATPLVSSNVASASPGSPTGTRAARVPGAASTGSSPSIAWPIPGDYASVMGDYGVNDAGGGTIVLVTLEMRNTGTTTWDHDGVDYYLGCVANCPASYQVTALALAPGQSQTFALDMSPPIPFTTATSYSQWAMFHSGVRFGEIATIKTVATRAIPLGVDPAPGCDSSSMSWTLTGGVCANDGVELTTNATQEPTVTLQSGPAGFDGANFMITAQVSFSTVTGAWVRIIGYNSDSSQCEGQGVDVQPDGTWRFVAVTNCQESESIWRASSLGPAPFSVTLLLQPDYFIAYINEHVVVNGGAFFTSGYPVISVGGADGSVITVTNVELDKPISYTLLGSVVQNPFQLKYNRHTGE